MSASFSALRLDAHKGPTSPLEEIRDVPAEALASILTPDQLTQAAAIVQRGNAQRPVGTAQPASGKPTRRSMRG